MRIILIICICCYTCNNSYSQNDSIINNNKFIQHNLFIELLGNSAYSYNITYDCTFALSQKNKIAMAAGVGYVPPCSEPSVGVSFQANYLYGKKHYFEFGTGITLPEVYSPSKVECSYNDNGHWRCISEDWKFSTRNVVIPVRIGYRYQRNEGGFFWKIAFVPLFSKNISQVLNVPFLPSAGIAFGYTFKTNKKKH